MRQVAPLPPVLAMVLGLAVFQLAKLDDCIIWAVLRPVVSVVGPLAMPVAVTSLFQKFPLIVPLLPRAPINPPTHWVPVTVPVA